MQKTLPKRYIPLFGISREDRLRDKWNTKFLKKI